MSDLFSRSLFNNDPDQPLNSPKDKDPEINFSTFLKNVELDEEVIDSVINLPQVEEENKKASYFQYSSQNSSQKKEYTLPENFLDSMNPEQKEAVLYDQGSLLILAGAGSGKTRVITHRFAYLIKKYDLNIHNILCVTFTNKAAGEMKERISGLLGVSTRMSWIRTFHSMCTMILREHAHRICFSHDFTIYDASDTKNTIKKIMERLNIDPKDNPDKAIARAISSAKEELMTPEDMEKNARSTFDHLCAEIYKEYRSVLRQNQAMDFGDLIVNTILLLENCPDVRENYQHQWRFIMADEFQDTNKPQYRLLTLLSADKKNVCVVGDDDQSIYGWRGARVENIRQFQEEFSAHIIRLEKNYRSHATILEAANSVVKSIKGRMPKTLKPVREKGDKITFKCLDDARQQASYIFEQMQILINKGKNYKDFAVLYRTNAQSRVLEEMFTCNQIPYKIYGGQRFFDRAEVKDILSYLRVIVNPYDAEAFDRIVNVPKRKIGDAGKSKIDEFLQQTKLSYSDACLQASSINGLGKSVSDALINLGRILTELRDSMESTQPTQIIKILLESIKYFEVYLVPKYGTHEAEDRFENIQELVNAVKIFEEANPNTTIADFLREASLLSSLNEEEIEDENVVSLMTIHSAKGLEFPIVFVIGLAEGVLPLSSSRGDRELDEEKRLFYVAITRAMDKLYLTYEQKSLRYGESVFNEQSHFIDAIPQELLDVQTVTHKTMDKDDFVKRTTSFGKTSYNRYNKNSASKNNHVPQSFVKDKHSVQDVLAGSVVSNNMKTEKIKTLADISLGDRVIHGMFGQGVVEYISTAMVRIVFEKFGTQVLMGNSISNLKKIISE
ncbi:MAG: ATP-dependent helicase [Brevinema sp.]